MAFNRGDRVTVIEDFQREYLETLIGLSGTVICSKNAYGDCSVEFDSPIDNGHNGLNPEYLGKDGYCWNLPPRCLAYEYYEEISSVDADELIAIL